MRKITWFTMLFAFISSFAIAAEVNVFNARHYKADEELYKKFTSKTKIHYFQSNLLFLSIFNIFSNKYLNKLV